MSDRKVGQVRAAIAPDRVRAVVVAVLFVATMAVAVIDANVVTPRLADAADSADPTAMGSSALALGAFCLTALALGVIGIAAAIGPVIRRTHEGVAATYLGFRVFEGALFALGAIGYAALARLLPAAGDAAATDSWATLASQVVAVKEGSYLVAMVALGVGGSLLGVAMARARILPRWLALWGAAGYVLLLASAGLGLAGVLETTDTLTTLLYVPGGLWEIIGLPAWLLIRGFTAPTHARADG